MNDATGQKNVGKISILEDKVNEVCMTQQISLDLENKEEKEIEIVDIKLNEYFNECVLLIMVN